MRNCSPSMLAAMRSNMVRPARFVQIAFLNETVWLWSGLGKITPAGPAWNSSSSFPYGQAFTGMGVLGRIRVIPQVSDVAAQNITLELSGIPSEYMADIVNYARLNSVCTIWDAALDSNGQVIPDPVQVWQGALDVPTSTDGATTSSISITSENPLIDLNRAPLRRYTDVDQQLDYPGDSGFSQVQLLQDYNFTWPSPFGASDSSTAPPSVLTITPGQSAPICLSVGGTQQLTVTVTGSDGSTYDGNPSPGLEGGTGGPFYTSDPSVATVSESGLVTAVGQGMCVITKRYVLDEYSVSGTRTDTPSNCVTASVTVVVTG